MTTIALSDDQTKHVFVAVLCKRLNIDPILLDDFVEDHFPTPMAYEGEPVPWARIGISTVRDALYFFHTRDFSQCSYITDGIFRSRWSKFLSALREAS